MSGKAVARSGAHIRGYGKSRYGSTRATQCPVAQLGNPVSGGYKYRGRSCRLGAGREAEDLTL
jgi:hypothetical protein